MTSRPEDQASIDARRGYTDADLAAVSDNPEWTDATQARSKSFAEFFPADAAAIAGSLRGTRGKQKAPTKQLVSLRLDREVIERYKAGGRGWQVRMGEALRTAIGL